MSGTDDKKNEDQSTPPETRLYSTPGADPNATIDSPSTSRVHLSDANLDALSERFALIQELGRGGMGIVYKARDKVTDEIVALKVLRPEIAQDPALIERFKSEVRLSKKITHKNVCRIHDLHLISGTAAITMEFVKGRTLRSWLLENLSFSIRRGTQIAQQIISGLKEAHDQGIVHRDLKPENLMLTPEGNIKIMDFGIARSLEGSTTVTEGLTGTPAYMSPEQAEGKKIDHRTDIYSLGLILYEMFTGQRAFTGDTPVAVAFKHVHETPTTPRDIDPDVPLRIERAILKCLEKQPKKRFQSVEELDSSLGQHEEPALAGETSSTDSELDLSKIKLPPHLAGWQRSDYYILVLGIIGLIIFALATPTVFPYPLFELQISRDDAIAKATSIVHEYESEATLFKVVGPTQPFGFRTDWARDVLLLGNSEAHRRWFTQKTGWVVSFRIRKSIASPTTFRRANVTLDYKGKLIYLSFDGGGFKVDFDQLDPKKLEMKAAHAVQDLFGIDLNETQARQLPTTGISRVQGVLRFFWEVPGPSEGSKYMVHVHQSNDGISSAGKQIVFSKTDLDNNLSADEEKDISNRLFRTWNFFTSVVGIALLAVLLLVLFITKSLAKSTNKRILGFSALCVVGFGIISLATKEVNLPGDLFSYPAGGVILLILTYSFLSSSDYYLTRSFPSRVVSMASVTWKISGSRPAGLALVRGIIFGFIYLAVHTGIIAALLAYRVGAPGMDWLIFMGGVRANGLFVLGVSIIFTIFFSWCFIAFPAAVASRISHKKEILIIAPAALWLGAELSLVGGSAVPQGPMYAIILAQALSFSWVFVRFDILTLIMTIFTSQVFLIGLVPYYIYRSINFWEAYTVFLVWALISLAGLVVFLWPHLAETKRRVAAIFE